MNTGSPKTLIEAVRYFSDLDVAQDYFVKIRWPQGVCCPHCGSINVHYLANQRRWKCKEKHPRPQFSAKIGTIFEESPLGLDKWLVAVWLEINAKNSISSYELGRALGVTQKSAWFMLHRVRFALHQGSFDMPLSGVIEADETFIGGLSKKERERKITGTGGSNKTAVMGLLARHDGKRHSTVRAVVVPDTRRETLQPIIASNVEAGSTVYTDAFAAYRSLGMEYFHDFVDHAETYVKGAVHTNGLENFWALFKRCIKGTHVSVEPFHLGAYVDSEAFRFNNRETDDRGRFAIAMRGVSGKRMTYERLTGKNEPEGRIASDSGEESGSDNFQN